ncbi:uncharacterized protein LOC132720546 isoform X2 [Ruditapes philippinarum]|uniref:uncharacterized protein LOC132720546 isoform X2 n=1 Tax=Ruditapes philippinarum TaxID=129788 RepID=UPI00295B16F2|nr:uncharacterized protein LOC132720546 isoform X2 [Ruditapes philippinarum]XP_060560688.1 uncharacterized protein LOC132720546 isoform X2 [Ruditapes philippinarum]
MKPSTKTKQKTLTKLIMANIVGFVGIGLSALVIALACASLSSKYWQTVELAGGVAKLNMGLWDYCLEVSGTKTCTKIKDESSISDEAKDDANACKAMIFVAIFVTLAASITGGLVMFALKEKKILYFVAGGLDISAGIFFMIAMAIYVEKLKNDESDLHVGFALDVVSWILAWAAGGIFFGAKFMDKD